MNPQEAFEQQKNDHEQLLPDHPLTPEELDAAHAAAEEAAQRAEAEQAEHGQSESGDSRENPAAAQLGTAEQPAVPQAAEAATSRQEDAVIAAISKKISNGDLNSLQDADPHDVLNALLGADSEDEQ